MAVHELAKFVLKRTSFMVPFLIDYIRSDAFALGLADRERSIPRLPLKETTLRPLGLDPQGRSPFEFLDPIRQGDRAVLPC